MHSALSRRLRSSSLAANEEDVSALASYVYHTMTAKGGSERSMNTLLQPVLRRDQRGGVYARRSLQQQLVALKMPVTVIHGKRDWMYSPVWQIVAARLPNFSLDFVDSAGHLLFIENAPHFNERLAIALRRGGGSGSGGSGPRPGPAALPVGGRAPAGL